MSNSSLFFSIFNLKINKQKYVSIDSMVFKTHTDITVVTMQVKPIFFSEVS